jgi:hypothetical protein
MNFINVREDEVEPGGFVGTARRADALVWGTVEEHRFTLPA